MKYKLENIQKVAKNLLAEYAIHSVWCFQGEMGAGKTTLIKELCKELGVLDDLSSPTFSLVNEYLTDSNQTIYHFDFYRIESEVEALDMGAVEYFDSGDLCFIEWPEKVEGLLPEDYIQITIKLVDDITRDITVFLND